MAALIEMMVPPGHIGGEGIVGDDLVRGWLGTDFRFAPVSGAACTCEVIVQVLPAVGLPIRGKHLVVGECRVTGCAHARKRRGVGRHGVLHRECGGGAEYQGGGVHRETWAVRLAGGAPLSYGPEPSSCCQVGGTDYGRHCESREGRG